MEITRHFTATTVIVCKQKTLLCFHKKLKKWLPVGGHIDRDETPQEAAIREVKEESGLDVNLFYKEDLATFSDVRELIPPMRMFLEDINEHHQHIDFIFYAKVDSESLEQKYIDEHSLKWFTVEELKVTADLPEDVLDIALDAISVL